MKWLKYFKPTKDWDISMVTINKNGVNFHIYPDRIQYLMKDYIFVTIFKFKGENREML